MKEYLENINKAFESKARLGIMSILIVNESVDFVTLKNLLDLTAVSYTHLDVYKRQPFHHPFIALPHYPSNG